MGDLEEGYRDAGDRFSKTRAVWEALCLIAFYCTANFSLLPLSNWAIHLSARLLLPMRFCTSNVASSA